MRMMGRPVQDGEIKDSTEFMQDYTITELRSVRRSFKWTNNHVYNKLDKVVVNAQWIHQLPHLQTIVMDPGCYDHSPFSITLEDDRHYERRPFKFFNIIVEHPDFYDIVEQAWTVPKTRYPMRNVCERVNSVKVKLELWNTQSFTRIDKTLKVL
ncbi:hypothetical protein FXO38_17538 [Capsicum annuum]|uniref:Uncharacterized protein n=1 Tax=Capsicum annuum TaxID=4072 RepID=A0A2G2YK22_CAPAN|nr:hypothetical protein FXO37_36115 [Capsicum annuum]KAF3649649.1 hypothetical protein FXO38_17538 [Capsicum annuum]PHT70096.1 hypothetical protein T459_25200 [Capsicum annuum]